MATTRPSEEDMTGAERYLIGNRTIELQAGDEVARDLASLWIFGLPWEELGRESERIQKVTAQDIEAVGKKYFTAARQAVVAVGEEKVVKGELTPFGIDVQPVP